MNQQHFIVRPDLAKNILVMVLKVGVAIGALVGVLYFFSSMGILQVFEDLAVDLGLSVGFDDIKLWLIIALLFVGGLSLLMTYFNVSSSEYEFFADHLEARSKKLIIFEENRSIPYQNIVKVTMEKQGIFEGIIGTSILNLELTGLKDASYKIPFVDGAEELAGRIQSLINFVQMRTTQQFQQAQQMNQQDNKINNIMDEF